MILKNDKGGQRNVKALIKINKDNKEFMVYEDIYTSKLYAGKYESDTLMPLDDKEFTMINSMLKKILGSEQ